MVVHEIHMRRALELARAGIGRVSPNPAVGAVIVDASGREIAAGTHTYDGVKHAEVLALEQAGKRARGATLYVNLEPCSHQGRTGPCADAIISAGITRVACAMQDPNPAVAGQGFEKLRHAGITVEIGQCAEDAKKLNESFARYIRSARPFITLKSAMTLDGKIARNSNSPSSSPVRREWITGEKAQRDVQRLRHEHDAILVGLGTVLTDDPLLTDRSGLPRRRRLLRTIMDSHLQIPVTSRVIQSAENDVLIFYSSSEGSKIRELQARGILLHQAAVDSSGRPLLADVLRQLGTMEITSVLIEGGARVNGTALATGEVDKVFLYFAPKIFGEGVPFSCIEGPLQGNRIELKSVAVHQFDNDLALEGYLRDPYQE